jgi:aminocarboxymuconate-semialdehyde decarboxylase
MKIDVHTHIMPLEMPKWAEKFGYKGFISLEKSRENYANMMQDEKFFREVYCNCWDCKIRKQEMGKFNVDMQVLSTIPVLFNYWAEPKDALGTSRFLNDHIAACVADDKKSYFGLGTIPMQDSDLAIKEMRRVKEDLKLNGIEIGTHINGKNFDDASLFPIFEAAEQMNVPIFIHPWDMLGGDRVQNYWGKWLISMPAETTIAITSLVFGGVLEKLPNLKIMFAHGGGSFPGTLGRIEHGWEVRPDLIQTNTKMSPRDVFGKVYFDSLTHDKTMLKYLVELAGSEFVSLGTDYPFPLGELSPGELIESVDEFDRNTKDNLLYKSALNWLGIKEEDIGK